MRFHFTGMKISSEIVDDDVLTERFLWKVIWEVPKSLLIARYDPFSHSMPRISGHRCRWINYLIIHGFIILAGRLTTRPCRYHLSREISSFHHLSRRMPSPFPLSISESVADVDAFVSLSGDNLYTWWLRLYSKRLTKRIILPVILLPYHLLVCIISLNGSDMVYNVTSCRIIWRHATSFVHIGTATGLA